MEDCRDYVVLRFHNKNGQQQWVVPIENIFHYLMKSCTGHLIIPVFCQDTGLMLSELEFTKHEVPVTNPDGATTSRITTTLHTVEADGALYMIYSTTKVLSTRTEELLAATVSTEKSLARRVSKAHEVTQPNLHRL